MPYDKDKDMIASDLKSVKIPSLTLDPEQSIRETESVQEKIESVDESMFSEEEKRQIEEFVSQIDVTNVKMINSYGASAQNSIAAFSTSITENRKAKEFGEIGDSLGELRIAINSTTVTEKKGILGLFQRGKNKVSYLVSNYETAEESIKKIEKDLQHHRQILTKDIYLYDQMYNQNMEFYKEITMYIVAGKKALAKAQGTRLVELKERAEATRDPLAVQLYRDYEDACKRFEKRIYDLETTRLVSIQTAPQIRILQNTDQEVADKLRSDVINTIPMWRNQMVLTLGIEHSRSALDAQSAVTDMTNEMFRRNAETLKQGAIDAALASEKALVDVETLKKVNADIITSINEVVKIHEEGTRKRTEAQAELTKIEEELKQALLQAGNKV